MSTPDTEAQTEVSASWLLQTARHGFGAWLVTYGTATLFSPEYRVTTSAVNDLAAALDIRQHYLLCGLFLISGILTLIPRSRSVGLFVATVFMSIYDIGLVITAFRGTGATTSPVTFTFACAGAALLWSLRDVR